MYRTLFAATKYKQPFFFLGRTSDSFNESYSGFHFPISAHCVD
jgi:hypothetical protein